ncbi:MAG: hypothetical protein ACREFE_11970, partial [Limisphaerales bacterium]
KDDAVISLHHAQARAEQLQTQLGELKNSNAESQSVELSRLRAENLALPRLRNQVTQLQATNRQLSLQLKAALTAAQQQQDQLQQLQAQNQQTMAATQQSEEQPQSLSETAQLNCINNLRQIEAAKLQWALENNKTVDAVPTAQDLAPYFPDRIFPTCPSGGTYTINAVGEPPTCSIPGHVLPQQ